MNRFLSVAIGEFVNESHGSADRILHDTAEFLRYNIAVSITAVTYYATKNCKLSPDTKAFLLYVIVFSVTHS